jgi:hypothetical protein
MISDRPKPEVFCVWLESVNIVSFNLSQSDHIKQFPLAHLFVWSLIMLSICLCDQIKKVSKTASNNILCMTRVSYYHQKVYITSFNLSESDHIKQFPMPNLFVAVK